MDINHPLAIGGEGLLVSKREGPVESNERYYRRRAIEERFAARRAITDQAKAWHAKLAEDFAARAIDSTAAAASCTSSALTA